MKQAEVDDNCNPAIAVIFEKYFEISQIDCLGLEQ